MIKEYAPIVLFVYNRPEKTRNVLESLSKNKYVSDSHLFIYSDGAKNADQIRNVENVRAILHEYEECNVFKSICVTYQENNKGLANSVIEGVTDVISKFGKVIVLEDDLILSPFFIEYMNLVLCKYEKDERIWAVGGYTPMLKSLENYKQPIYLNYRASSWGWGTWEDRWNKIDWNVPDYNVFRHNPFAIAKLSRGGNDMPSMLRAQMKGRIDSWAIRWCYYQSKYNMLSVAPKKSFVKNDGLDGSGMNCNEDGEKSFGQEKLADKILVFDDIEIKIDRRINREFYKLNSLTIINRLSDFVNRYIKRG